MKQLKLDFALVEEVVVTSSGKTKLKPTHADFSSESNEYYTPHQVIQLSRKVLSNIDLDPASCELANSSLLGGVRADRFFTIQDNGLKQKWFGSVLCNPPGGKIKNESQAALWWDKALLEWESLRVDSVIFVAFNPELISRRQNVWDYQVCIPDHRLAFVKVGLTGVLEVDPSPPKFNAIIHLPSRVRDTASSFYEEFSKIGRVIKDCSF